MTALPHFIIPKKKQKLPQPKLLTFVDYARFTPLDSGNYELHNGKIIYIPTPLFPHQSIVGNLLFLLGYFVKNNKLGVVVSAPMDVILTENDTVQPDILFISQDRLNIIDGQIKGAPDLVVEIQSGGNTKKEMSYKKHLYESSGVKEYWLINPEKKTLTQYENIEGEFFPKNVLNTAPSESLREGVLKAIVVEGFELKIGDIFA